MIETAFDAQSRGQAMSGVPAAATGDGVVVRLEGHERPSRLPVTLYRVQLHRGFTFDDVGAVVPYLARVGITDLYASPSLTAGRGSTHGYDISDHGALNPELGGAEAHARLARILASHHFGHLLDIVPNHMAADAERNLWWRDVLENGPSSPYARYFDIDWTPVKPELTDKVLLPILGDQYGLVLERGELRLGFEQGALVVGYYDASLPVNPTQAVMLLRHDLDRLREQHGDDDPHVREFLSILTALQNLPSASERDADKVAERHREKEVARDRLARLVEASPAVRAQIDEAIRVWNGVPGDPRSFDRLHALLDAQCYRLAYWRTASDEINYRRFFDVNQLAGIRMEEPAVFDATHVLILRLVADGTITGLRLDHPDGLHDPIGYVDRLQEGVRQIHAQRAVAADATTTTGEATAGEAAAGGATADGATAGEASAREAMLAAQRRPLYIALEKILSPNEALPSAWAAYGTTTYSFLTDLTALLVDSANAKSMRRIYARLTGRTEPFANLMYQGKKLIMLTSLASEMNVLSHALNDISEGHRHSRDFTLNGLGKALMEVIACFPVYRTYVSARGASETDRLVIRLAIARAKRRNPAMERSIFDFIEQALIPPGPLDEAPQEERATRERHLAFAMRFQQYTGPVHAKGVEDTAFYRYNVLVSLNEVGGEPDRFGRSPAEFHASNQARRERWPYEMIGTATHDTKRGEDARARISVLSEMPDEWRRVVGRWMRANGGARAILDGEPAPDRNDEYLYYQTLVGAWPAEALDAPAPTAAPDAFVERIQRYMLKAVKEAKLHTSWVNENQPYEQALTTFISRTLRGPSARTFLRAFVPFQRRVARFGAVNSLTQVALKICSPGVVDLYQGTELWDLNLVDPDNRRPVDFELRGAMLDDLSDLIATTDATARDTAVRHLLEQWTDARIKLLILTLLLRQRAADPDLFLDGDYVPLAGADSLSDRHLVAFARTLGSRAIVVVAPRFTSQLVPEPTAWPLGFDTWRTQRVLLPGAHTAPDGGRLSGGGLSGGEIDGREPARADGDGPPSLASRTFRHLITGASVRPLIAGREASLPAADLFKTCPLAVLIANEP